MFPPDNEKAVLLEWGSASWFYIQRPFEDQPRHPPKVCLPRPGLPEWLLGEGAARGALQWGNRYLLLGGQKGQSVLPNQRLQPNAVLQWCACLWTSVGPYRHLWPHKGGPASRWVMHSEPRLGWEVVITGVHISVSIRGTRRIHGKDIHGPKRMNFNDFGDIQKLNFSNIWF